MAERDELHAAAERTMRGLDTAVEAVVRQVLDDVAAELAEHLAASGHLRELVAQGEPLDDETLRRVMDAWLARITAILAALLGVYGAAAAAVRRWLTGEDTNPAGEGGRLVDAYLDEGVEALPDRVQRYLRSAENRLRDVGDRLWEAAREALADGVAEGEGIDQLRRRLQRVFAEDGVQLGDARAERIARTEVLSAWNRGAWDEAREDADRPLIKEWISTLDRRTRDSHFRNDGARVPLDEPFTVGGFPLQFPGDPLGPPQEVINCRCSIAVDWDEDDVPRGADRDRGRQYLSDEEIADVVAYYEERGIVRAADQDVTAAADGSHTKGAMIALMPTAEDAERLTIPGGEAAGELHLTLWFLGDDGTVWGEDVRNELEANVRAAARSLFDGPVVAMAFGAAHWNPGSDWPAWVWSVGDDREGDGPKLADVRDVVTYALEDLHDHPELPVQHSPWQPHVCAAYSADPGMLAALEERLGPIVFDRIRLSFADHDIDIPLGPQEDEMTADATEAAPRRWSTPGDAALAYEGQETGDGRIFAPGALHWDGPGPWPLQYADEMLMGHEGAELAGAIEAIGRDGARITGMGVLYPHQPAGAAAIRLLEEGAPLGVSVDLDDVDIEVIDRRPPEERGGGDEVVLLASLTAASLVPVAGGGFVIRATHAVELAADGHAPVRATHTVEWRTDAEGRVPAVSLRAALTAAGVVTAAAGDPDSGDGEVLSVERAGDLVMRVTRGRVRGATLVSMPAFAQARVVLDGVEVSAAADAPSGRMQDVVSYVASSPVPVGAVEVGRALGITVTSARGYLARAVQAGWLVRLARGLYVASATMPETRPDLVAAMSGDTDLPIHDDRDAEWDGDAAASRVLEWATGDDGEVDAARLGRAFLYRDPDKDAGTLAAYKLGIADVFDGELHIVPRAVFAVAGVLQGARGGVDIPDEEQSGLRYRVSGLYGRLAEVFDDPGLMAPWDHDDGMHDDDMDDLEASAWQEFQALPPLPAHWFAEPTPEELPTDQGPVHVTDDGRIFGWVARKGVCHDGYTGQCLTIDQLGDVDTTYFLRSRIKLDDGETIRVGVFTMNAGHDNDGSDVNSTRALFDDTRTVAGIVTVGANDRGLWFAGAAAPWLSAWDMATFAACAPSGHWRRERDGRWSLRAVLSVPVPGYPTRLAASTVIGRANMALAASAAPAGPVLPLDVGALAAALAPAVADELERRQAAREEIERLAEMLAPARAEVAASMAAQLKGGI